MAVKFLKDNLKKMILQDSEVCSNLSQVIIISTEDKIELCLRKYLEDLGSRRGWITPLSLLFTIILTFLTTDFKKWYFSSEVWQAIFIVAAIIILGWLIESSVKALKAKKIKDVLEEIKKSAIKSDKEKITSEYSFTITGSDLIKK